MPELRKLTLESFLARPTTRLGRYLLLLKPAYEKAPENHPDRVIIPQAILGIREVLHNVNIQVGISDNRLKLSQLNSKLLFLEGDREELKLLDPKRLLVRDGMLLVKKTTADVEVNVFLFDHALLITRKKENGFKIFKKVFFVFYERRVILLDQHH